MNTLLLACLLADTIFSLFRSVTVKSPLSDCLRLLVAVLLVNYPEWDTEGFLVWLSLLKCCMNCELGTDTWLNCLFSIKLARTVAGVPTVCCIGVIVWLLTVPKVLFSCCCSTNYTFLAAVRCCSEAYSSFFAALTKLFFKPRLIIEL